MMTLRHASCALILLSLLMSCSSPSSTAPTRPGEVSITDVPSDNQLIVGAVADLNATVAVDWASSDSAVASVDADGIVSGLAAGSVDISATSQADASKTATVTLDIVAASASCSSTVPLSEDIDAATTLPLACHLVTDSIDVNADLTISAGATLLFEKNTALVVKGAGSIAAQGTATSGVTFTSAADAPAAGDWKGINISSGSAKNKLEYVTLSYGSGETTCCSQSEGANIYVESKGRLSLSNSLISAAEDYGLYAEDTATLSLDANTFQDIGKADLSVASNQLGSLDQNAASSYSGTVEARDSVVATSQTWKANLPVLFTGVTALRSSATPADVVIEAGSALKFATNAVISVGDGGALIADGTLEKGISFSSAAATPALGDWKGLHFSSSSNKNLLNYVTVSHGSGETTCCSQAEGANIYVEASGRLSLTNSTVSDAEDYGFYAEDAATIDLDGNTYSGNVLADISVASNQLGSVDQTAASSYASIAQARGSVIERSQVWKKGLPFTFTGVSAVRSAAAVADITVEAGSTLKFATDAVISVGAGGSFTASGTASAGITFTSASSSPAAGDWKGLHFSSDSNKNKLSYVTVAYGSGDTTCCSQAEGANIYIEDRARLTVSNSTLSNAEDYGLYAEDAALVNADVCTANSYTNNGVADCFIEP